MHQKRHQPLHQVQPLQQPQQPLPRHTSVNRHGVVVALEDDDLDLLQVRMICNVQWVQLKQTFQECTVLCISVCLRLIGPKTSLLPKNLLLLGLSKNFFFKRRSKIADSKKLCFVMYNGLKFGLSKKNTKNWCNLLMLCTFTL